MYYIIFMTLMGVVVANFVGNWLWIPAFFVLSLIPPMVIFLTVFVGLIWLLA